VNREHAVVIGDGLLRLGSVSGVRAQRPRGIVFLDRDGVINELVVDPRSGACESPLEESSVRLIPGASRAVARLIDGGFVVMCVSNQPAAAKGAVSVAELLDVHTRVIELVESQGAAISASYLCLHHPSGVVPELARRCDCRKPSPGMLLTGARALDIDPRDTWMVGDTDTDVRAGKAAGSRTALLRYPGSFHKRGQGVNADLTLESLGQVADILNPENSN
jgi:D-glycero-D-manno-heptose 1,7-bisphosphate phosphatase